MKTHDKLGPLRKTPGSGLEARKVTAVFATVTQLSHSVAAIAVIAAFCAGCATVPTQYNSLNGATVDPGYPNSNTTQSTYSSQLIADTTLGVLAAKAAGQDIDTQATLVNLAGALLDGQTSSGSSAAHNGATSSQSQTSSGQSSTSTNGHWEYEPVRQHNGEVKRVPRWVPHH